MSDGLDEQCDKCAKLITKMVEYSGDGLIPQYHCEEVDRFLDSLSGNCPHFEQKYISNCPKCRGSLEKLDYENILWCARCAAGFEPVGGGELKRRGFPDYGTDIIMKSRETTEKKLERWLEKRKRER